MKNDINKLSHLIDSNADLPYCLQYDSIAHPNIPFWKYIPNDLGNWPRLIKIGLDLPDRAKQANNKAVSFNTNDYRFGKDLLNIHF